MRYVEGSRLVRGVFFLLRVPINACLFLNQSEMSNFLKTVLFRYVFKDIFFNETKMKKKYTSNIQLKEPLFLANDEVVILKNLMK